MRLQGFGVCLHPVFLVSLLKQVVICCPDAQGEPGSAVPPLRWCSMPWLPLLFCPCTFNEEDLTVRACITRAWHWRAAQHQHPVRPACIPCACGLPSLALHPPPALEESEGSTGLEGLHFNSTTRRAWYTAVQFSLRGHLAAYAPAASSCGHSLQWQCSLGRTGNLRQADALQARAGAHQPGRREVAGHAASCRHRGRRGGSARQRLQHRSCAGALQLKLSAVPHMHVQGNIDRPVRLIRVCE